MYFVFIQIIIGEHSDINGKNGKLLPKRRGFKTKCILEDYLTVTGKIT